jgi:diguanylate cyclase (GGDEF)-like protein/PAS domain S-box-containing protein
VGTQAFDNHRRLGFGLPTRALAAAAIFVALEVGLISTVGTGLYVLGGLRAFASSESSWSKAQKDAVLHLRTYAESSQAADYDTYLRDMSVMLGDREAVHELDQPNPDLDRVRHGFIQGHSDPVDVDSMVWLFRTFGHVPRIAHTIDAWTSAELGVDRLQDIAASVHAGERSASTIGELDNINAQVAGFENEVASTMAQTARLVQGLVMLGALASSSLFLGFGCMTLLLLARRWKTADAAFTDELIRGHQALRVSQEHLRTVLNHGPIIVFAVDSNARVTLAEGSALATLGLIREDVLGRSFFEILANAPSTTDRMRRALRGELLHSHDRWNGRDFDSTLTPIFDRTGSEVIGVSGVAIDITERLRVQSQLEAQASIMAEQAALLDLAQDGILVWDFQSGAVRFWNRGAEVLYGWTSDEALGRTPDILLHTQFPHSLAEINAEVVRTGKWEGELVHTCRDGRRLVIASRWALQVDGDGQPRAVVAINRDISERKKSEHALAHQARHDALTGLPNRAFMQEALAAAIETLRRGSTPFALLLLDLDRFKDVNDTLGHGVGDTVLRHVAARLQQVLRPTDVIARFGGDEFAVLLPGAERSVAVALADRLKATLSNPIGLEGTRLDLGVSIGIAMGPDHGQDADLLMRRADVAMYAAKRGDIGAAVYTDDMDADYAERLQLTESMLMADAERAQSQLERLRAQGIRVAVDDFGTGYSSLAYLKRLPVDDLKIDRCFVRELACDERDQALVQAAVGMAHSLGLRVVAEGVEDAATLDILRSIGCDMMQGYHISRPLPADNLREWATRWMHGTRASPPKAA